MDRQCKLVDALEKSDFRSVVLVSLIDSATGCASTATADNYPDAASLAYRNVHLMRVPLRSQGSSEGGGYVDELIAEAPVGACGAGLLSLYVEAHTCPLTK